jgi:hypothetical protein
MSDRTERQIIAEFAADLIAAIERRQRDARPRSLFERDLLEHGIDPDAFRAHVEAAQP